MKKNIIKKFEKFIKTRVGKLIIIEESTNNLVKLPKFYMNNFKLYDTNLIINDVKKKLKGLRQDLCVNGKSIPLF